MLTLPYASPERVHYGGKYNYKSDIWSLGTILYELVTLKRMFRGNMNILSDIEDIRNCNYDKRPLKTIHPLFRLIIRNTVMIDPIKRWDAKEILKYIELNKMTKKRINELDDTEYIKMEIDKKD